MLTPIADAFLASASFIAHANLLLAQVQGLGAEAPHNKATAAPSFDEELEALLAGEEPLVLWSNLSLHKVAKESEVDAQWHIANSLEALACEGLGLGGATGAGKGSQQGQEEEEEEEGTKEKIPNTTAGAAMGAARKAPVGGTKRLALPTKKGSPTKLASKRRGCPMPRYEAPMQQDFLDKELARLLVPKQVEAVVDTGVEAGVVLKEIKGKVTVDLATCQAFKEERGVCDKCWADNDSEGCWYSMGASSCFSGEDIPLSSAGEKGMGSGGERDEERGSGKRKRKAFLPLSPMDKGKKRARVVSPVVVTPEIESEDDKEDEVRRLGVAIEASKAAPGVEDLAGSSCQAEAPQDIGALHKEMEQDEEEAKVRLKAASQAQPWGWGSPQWSWLPEWGANDPATWDVSSGNEPESWEPRRRVMARVSLSDP
ncbi:hypothetical protein C0993_009754 [Termitomyces sp. T159_Od127]|nr:hypothetical protein C0993_009754 [Termitomyces sp. T159_Od127]